MEDGLPKQFSGCQAAFIYFKWNKTGIIRKHHSFFFFLFLFLAALLGLWDIYFPDQGSKPGPRQRKCRVLTTGPPGNSQKASFLIKKRNVSRKLFKVCVCVCVCVRACALTVLGENVKCIPYCVLWFKKMRLRWYALQSKVFAGRWKGMEDERGNFSLSFFWPEPRGPQKGPVADPQE